MIWTPLKVLEWTTQRFADAGNGAARLDAQVLLAHVLECDRVALYTGFDKPLGDEELGRYRELIRRRLAGEPTAYLVGEKEFWSLALAVDARVLIPRPDTEVLVEVAVALAKDRAAVPRIAEVATGSGAVAIALATELPTATIVATDLSAGALAVATANVERHGVAERVSLREGDLLAPLAGEQFDVIVANLPYIPAGDIAGLAPEVQCEPRGALDGGPDGLDLLRRLCADVRSLLAPGGAVALEHDADQAAEVRGLLADFATVDTRADLAGNPRVTVGA